MYANQVADLVKFFGIDALVAVRISSTLLKPAALLLLGASAVFGGAAANALTFNWSFINSSGTPSSSGSATSGTITGLLDNTTNNLDTSPSITLTVLSATNLSAPYFFDSADNVGSITVLNGAVTAYNGVFFNNNGGNQRLYMNDSNDAFYQDLTLSRYDRSQTSNPVTFTASAAAVPGPLPILGLPAAFLSTRKLRRRIKASREVASTSLD